MCTTLFMFTYFVIQYNIGNFSRGENVEEAFLDTAKKIYQNIQDGRYKLAAYYC